MGELKPFEREAEAYSRNTRSHLDGSPFLDESVVTDFQAGAHAGVTCIEVKAMREALASTISRCHTGCCMIHPCVSIDHDNSHVRFLETEQGRKESAIEKIIIAYDELLQNMEGAE